MSAGVMIIIVIAIATRSWNATESNNDHNHNYYYKAEQSRAENRKEINDNEYNQWMVKIIVEHNRII